MGLRRRDQRLEYLQPMMHCVKYGPPKGWVGLGWVALGKAGLAWGWAGLRWAGQGWALGNVGLGRDGLGWAKEVS